jgi:imidazolonepropionase-like amidohydrolase
VQALDRVSDRSQAELDATVIESLRRHLGAGVTTVRDLGDRDFGVVARRDAQRALDDGLPWIVASGPPLTTPGGHCHFLGGEISGREQIEAALQERAERGVDVVKVMSSGGFNTMGTDVFAPQFAQDELRLIVERAHDVGLPVTAHAHAAAAVDQAVAVGVDGIEHATFLVRTPGAGSPASPLAFDQVATDDQLDVLAASGIPVCPTLGGTLDPGMFANVHAHGKQLMARAGITAETVVEKRRAWMRRMTDSGVRFICGADAGMAPQKDHGKYADAVAELGQFTGIEAALRAATSGAAEAIGLGSSKGRLEPGFDADVLVVDGDLSAGLSALRDVRQVVVRGHAHNHRPR